MMETTPAVPLRGVHHTAFRCRDAGQTRWFYEEVLGLKALAGLIIETVPGTTTKTPFMHIFFQLSDGNHIAFFDSPFDAATDSFTPKHSFDMHIAIEAATKEDMLAMQRRINAMGIACLGPVAHGFVESIYMYDPNGIQCEITWRTPDHDQIMAEEASQLDEAIAAWSERTLSLKLEKFGSEALLNHGSPWPPMGH